MSFLDVDVCLQMTVNYFCCDPENEVNQSCCFDFIFLKWKEFKCFSLTFWGFSGSKVVVITKVYQIVVMTGIVIVLSTVTSPSV